MGCLLFCPFLFVPFVIVMFINDCGISSDHVITGLRRGKPETLSSALSYRLIWSQKHCLMQPIAVLSHEHHGVSNQWQLTVCWTACSCQQQRKTHTLLYWNFTGDFLLTMGQQFWAQFHVMMCHANVIAAVCLLLTSYHRLWCKWTKAINDVIKWRLSFAVLSMRIIHHVYNITTTTKPGKLHKISTDMEIGHNMTVVLLTVLLILAVSERVLDCQPRSD